MAKLKKVAKAKATKSPAALDRDAKGKLITVGCIVCDDGPTFGRVVFISEGAVVYRPFPNDGSEYAESFPTQPMHTAYHNDLDVVDAQPPAMEGIGPCATKCLETALLLDRVLENLREIAEIAEHDDPFTDSQKFEDTVQDLHGEMFIVAGNAATCADYNRRNKTEFSGHHRLFPERTLQ